jgi:hypothetical protein
VPPVSPLPEDPLTTAIEHAREAFAEEMQTADGAPLLVTAEASPNADDGYSVVLQAHGQNYLYHTGTDGAAQLVNADFHFSETVGAWHAIESRPPHLPAESVSGAASNSGQIQTAVNLSLGGDGYFTSLGSGRFVTAHRQNHEEAFRQTREDSSDLSLLVLSALKFGSQRDGDAFFDRLQDQAEMENPFDLSDIDDVFGSLENLQLAKRSTIRQFHGR